MDITKISIQIMHARKKAGLTQEELAEKIGVTAQAVSKWENGHNLPDLENLLLIAELTNVPYTALLEEQVSGEPCRFVIRDRLFQEDNMYTRMKATALTEHLSQTYRALSYMRERHAGQFRKAGKYTTEQVRYINHPLMMACQAHAFGIHDDALLASILLHDVVEDTGVGVEELPFSDEVRQIVRLVSFSVPPNMTKEQAKDAYYARIRTNGKACVVKIIDRCNNISTMAGKFPQKKIAEHILETETYILPLIRELKNNYPEYSDVAFLVKYHIISVLETVKILSMG